jgi:hypothetical protein
MKWFFALSENKYSFPRYSQMAKVAVYSAYLFTDLEPFFLYDGGENFMTDWLIERGVTIVRHRTVLYDGMVRLGGSRAETSGVVLRADIPLLLKNMGWKDEAVFYTDTDVQFNGKVELDQFKPRLFAVAPEFSQMDYFNINTGAMLMNIDSLYQTYVPFIRFFDRNLHFFVVEREADQTAYKCYYNLEWDHLPLEYNWKPYWGENPNARIIHFHGPKPLDADEIRKGIYPPHYEKIICDRYFELVEVWREYLKEAEGSFSFGGKGKIIECNPTVSGSDEDVRNKKGDLVVSLMKSKNGGMKECLELSEFFGAAGQLEAEIFYLMLAHDSMVGFVSVCTTEEDRNSCMNAANDLLGVIERKKRIFYGSKN